MKKFLTSVLALAMVMSLAGAVLAAHEPVENPTKPGEVEKVASSDVVVLSSDSVVGLDKTKVTFTPVTKSEDLAKDLNDLVSDKGFVSADIKIEGKAPAGIIVPVTTLPLSAVSDDLSKDKTLEFTLVISEEKFPNSPAILVRAHYNGTETVTSTDLVSGDWYGAKVATMTKIENSKDHYKVVINSPKFFFSGADATAVDLKPVSSPSSSGGCNVGFAPMALLLGLPLFFLKK